MRQEQSMGEYLAALSVRHEVYPGEFLSALVTAKDNCRSTCGNLSIECRSKSKDKTTFLIKNGAVVVAQFPIPTRFLSDNGNPLLDYMNIQAACRSEVEEAEQTDSTEPLSIRDLHSGMNNINLKAKVLEVTPTRVVTTRYGNNARLAKALIADETGRIRLCLWDGQIDSVSPAGSILIANARASRFNGETQLSVGKKGTINIDSDISVQPPLSMSLSPAKQKIIQPD